ncbi:MAG: phosphopantetheine-binding protein [Mycobacterium sp.]|uniref:acyl carrier protein n=1 Tax=Mycobacterium sp. TaxID=1785 RepID=UPI003CC50182
MTADASDPSITCIIAGLAPDRMAPITADSHLVDDLGYDSPRKMELVATLESHLQIRLKETDTAVQTVRDVIDWVHTNLSETA